MSQNSIEGLLRLRAIGFALSAEDLARIEEWEKSQVPLETIEQNEEVKKFNSELDKVTSEIETVKNIVE